MEQELSELTTREVLDMIKGLESELFLRRRNYLKAKAAASTMDAALVEKICGSGRIERFVLPIADYARAFLEMVGNESLIDQGQILYATNKLIPLGVDEDYKLLFQ